MRALSLLQINTAAQLLNDKLNNKKSKVEEAVLTQKRDKYKKDVEEVVKKAIEVRKVLQKLEDRLQKEEKGKIVVDTYGIEKLITKKGSETNEFLNKEYSASLAPDYDKIRDEIDTFVLNLKLGTALMEDLNKMIERINKA